MSVGFLPGFSRSMTAEAPKIWNHQKKTGQFSAKSLWHKGVGMQVLASVAKNIRLDRTKKSYKVALRGVLVMRSRFCGFAVVLAMMVVGVAPNVFADSYTYTTAGCFVVGTCASDGSATANFLGTAGATLSFNNIGASTTTTSGVPFSLGSFDLSILNPSGASVYGGLFGLNVDFTNPAGTTGNPFIALVTGNVFFGPGGATISLVPGSQVFSYPGGSFILDLSTQVIQVSSVNPSATLYATIVSMPEGSSLAMLGLSGLVLFGVFFKKLRPRAITRAC
jgi:hypothetical protein